VAPLARSWTWCMQCGPRSNLKAIGKNAFKDAVDLKAEGLTLPAGTRPTIGPNAFQGVSASAVKVLSNFDFGGFKASCSSGLTLERD
jgi:hypothetical protein